MGDGPWARAQAGRQTGVEKLSEPGTALLGQRSLPAHIPHKKGTVSLSSLTGGGECWLWEGEDALFH